MPKRIGNTQTSSLAGHSDILDIRSHKKLVAQDVYPDTANDVVRGVRFDGDSYLYRTPSVSGDEKKWTLSVWLKRNDITTFASLFSTGSQNNNNVERFYLVVRPQIELLNWTNSSNYHARFDSPVLRDLGSWYHIIIVADVANAADRWKVFINGTKVTLTFSQGPNNSNSSVNRSGRIHHIGRDDSYTDYPPGNITKDYMSNFYLIDGQALEATDFGYYDIGTKQWKPKAYAGTYGANGFYLPMRVGQYTQDETGTALGYNGGAMVKGFKPQTNFNFGSIYFNNNMDAAFNDASAILGTLDFTIDLWFYATSLSGTPVMLIDSSFQLAIDSNEKVSFTDSAEDLAGSTNFVVSNTVITTEQWYHVAVSRDSSNKIRMWINGNYETAVLAQDGSGNKHNFNTSSTSARIGRTKGGAKDYAGYITDLRIVKNQALYTGDNVNFAPPNQPLSKTYDHVNQQAITGSVVLFIQPDAAGVDESGNNNDWTVNGMNKHDGVPDSPHNTFATLNPLRANGTKHNQLTISNGNLAGDVGTATSKYGVAEASLILPSSGKYYIETYAKEDGVGNQLSIGCIDLSSYHPTSDATARSQSSFSGIWFQQYSNFIAKYVQGSTVGSNETGIDGNRIIGLLFNIDDNEIKGYQNGTALYDGNSFGSPNYDNYGIIFETSSHASNRTDFNVNFGQDATFAGTKTDSLGPYTDANGIGQFYYQPPAGALALCTQNLPAPVIEDPEKHFNTLIYNGTGQTQIISGLAFQPDLVWMKNRDAGQSHALVDSVRNRSKVLFSDSTSAQQTSGSTEDLISFDSNGFSVGTPARAGSTNNSGSSIVAWSWRAAGSPAAGGSSAAGSARVINEDGGQADTTCAAIATAVTNNGRSNVIVPNKMSINHKIGFSIVQYSGTSTDDATLPTGINNPEFTIIKNMSGGNNSNGVSARWPVSLKGVTGTTKVVYLDDSQQGGLNYQGGAQTFNNDSVHIYKGSDHANGPFWRISETGSEYIMYCWKSIRGFSAFGSYTGNGNADGPFVYTGFKPAFVITKNIDGNGVWIIEDNARNPNNPVDDVIYADLPNSGGTTSNTIDFLSNGFKIRHSAWSDQNGTGVTIIYMAFAEQTINFTTAR